MSPQSLRTRLLLASFVSLPVWGCASSESLSPPGIEANLVSATSTYDCQAQSDIPATECSALLALYDALDGANWGEPWTDHIAAGIAPCSWPIVSCALGHVTELRQLGGANGVLPSELGDLPYLQVLQFRSNWPDEEAGTPGLHGSIPASIGNLVRLRELRLPNNALDGALPSNIAGMGQLQLMWIANNRLEGPLPAEIGALTNLRNLDLSRNPSLDGPIPASIGALTQLTNLNLTLTGVSGALPPEIGQLAALQSLNISSPSLTGPLPPELGQLTNLTTLSISSPALTGALPGPLFGLTSLRGLGLVGQDIGPLPEAVGGLSGLVTLQVRGLTGPIPAAIGTLSNLRTLDLEGPGMSGTLPASIGSLAQLVQLTIVSGPDRSVLSGLTGPIPASLGNLTNLSVINLFNNRLTGEIPASLGNLSRLSLLNLWNNQLTGNIPVTLTAIPFLWSVQLDSNLLSGEVSLAVATWLKSRACALNNNPGLYLPDTPAYRALDTDNDGLLCGLGFSSPASVVAGLEARVEALHDTGSLTGGQAQALKAKLREAMERSDRGRPTVALSMIRALENQLRGLVAGGVLTEEDAAPLFGDIVVLKALISQSG